ncbi:MULTISPECIES: hypothetical protein [Chryseobacterium]|uniref:Uncharacterized protein n=2 Tax=Chryseobacterium TaxID=59732 RepID=A0A0J7IWB1_9FLAO|nr:MULTISPECIES: hypothetical protein [Chryseobacterium]KMQ70101.1 hypothetical protein ACM44_14135 [Chryseobacterium koreense CCUG 49689]MBB5334412.1 hypothetical protein [Chryseobacterium koreense]UOE40594.1 hypothetical protein MTP09_11890 [Chryseobacterium suipulveris]
MKKQHAILPAMFLSLFLFSQEARISADIRGRDCHGGLGLCDVSGEPPSVNKDAVTVRKISGQSIAFVFDNRTLSTSSQRNIAGKEFDKISPTEKLQFSQEKDIILEDSLLDQLQIDRKYGRIKEGNYPLLFEKEEAVVIFTLSEK